MLISYLIYILRTLLVIFANFLKRRVRHPDYVIFTLHGYYPDLRQLPEGFIQKKMKPPLKSLQELEKEFQLTGKSPHVKGVILHLGSLALSYSQIQHLTQMIKDLQDEGKEVITWATGYNIQSYFLAAAADQILMQKGGVIHTLGFASRQIYMKDVLDWCGLEFDVVQVSPYKSALERFVRSNMSDEVREMTEWLLDSYYQQFVRAVARGRGLEESKVQTLIEKTPLYGEDALESGTIDGIVNAEDLSTYLGSNKKALRLASWDECGKLFPRSLPPLPGKYIAILRIQGNIIDGKSQRPPARPPLPIPFLFSDLTGDLTFVQQARQVLKDKRARAVLLYIDSGGGSAASSEAITSVLEKITTKKPLVALMSSIAGSGGYYVATPASYIVAQPATITGSIGVISAKIVDSRLLERLLLNRETIQRGQKELFASPEEPFTDEERERAQGFIDHIYDVFINRVAKSRSISLEKLEQIGGGKVWTGEQALEYGLVDELGGLQSALSKLRELAKLPQNTLLIEIPYPKRETAPLPTAASLIDYALENIDRVNKNPALLAGPFYFQNPFAQ